MSYEFIIDFTDVSTTDFEPIPDGIYSAVVDVTTIKDEGIRYGQNKGTPYVRIGFEIVSPPEFAKRKVVDQFMMAGPGAKKLARLLKAVGVTPELNARQRFNFKTIHGRPCTIKVGHREYNGQIYNQVDSIMPPAEDMPPTGTEDTPFD